MIYIIIIFFVIITIFIFVTKKISGNTNLMALLKSAPEELQQKEYIPNGLLATATVISSKNMGTVASINDGKSWYYQLLIEANVTNGTESWQATIKHQGRDYEIKMYQPGITFSVIYDPNDKSRVIVGNKPTSATSFDLFDVNNLKKMNTQDIINLTRPD